MTEGRILLSWLFARFINKPDLPPSRPATSMSYVENISPYETHQLSQLTNAHVEVVVILGIDDESYRSRPKRSSLSSLSS